MRHVPLSSKRLAPEDPATLPKLTLGAAWFLGPSAWRLNRAARRGDGVRRLERDWCARVASFLDVRFDIKGLEVVEPGGRYVVLTLHEGFADALALMRLGLDLRFVARDELFEWPTLGRYLKASGQILVETNRERSSYRRMLQAGSRVLDAGESLVVCPQGSILGIEVAFWPGAFALAERLEASILPVVLTGSHRIWEYPYSPMVRFGQRLSMRVLPPVPASQAMTAAPALERRMKELALHSDMAPARRFRPEIDGFWDRHPYQIDPAFPALAAVIDRHRRAAPR